MDYQITQQIRGIMGERETYDKADPAYVPRYIRCSFDKNLVSIPADYVQLTRAKDGG